MFYTFWHERSKPGAFAAREYADIDLDDPTAEHNLTDSAFPDFQPKFSPVYLSDDSSLVDFIDNGYTIGGQGLLVSEKVLTILEGMKLPPYQPYALEVVHRGKPVDKRYYWLQILALDNYHWIDFERSEFALRHHLEMDDLKGERVPVGSDRELKALVERKGGDFHVLYGKLTLNSAYARSPFDLFYFDRLGDLSSLYPIINERLKLALEKEGVAGYGLTERPEIVLDAR
jgi:hypothetical protein